MATKVAMRNPNNGLLKNGFFGFSWTTLFFGFFPALFRGDFITFIGGFVISMIIAFLTFGIGALVISLVWAFMYNKYYTRKLLAAGFRFADSEGMNAQASAALGVDYSTQQRA
ncbi:MAG: hypothetical protein GAK30_01562 [Paracidovorax wautersii]|uniref:HrgC protein n=1 Tax=Paracidovorax wautersii TaxID=1177982 RepID=A0A7V8FPP3_9BURK|nr:MAG: hypothetical protein GAK30_01562 [Paracidovorax wautersii]